MAEPFYGRGSGVAGLFGLGSGTATVTATLPGVVQTTAPRQTRVNYVECPTTVPSFREQRYSGRTCVPHVYLLSQQCNRETLLCWMFRIDRYQVLQAELQALLNVEPGTVGAGGAVPVDAGMGWCESVLRKCAQALDATNLQPWLVRATGLLTRFMAARRAFNPGSFHGSGDYWQRQAVQSRKEYAIDIEFLGSETNKAFTGPGIIRGSDMTGNIVFPAGTDVFPYSDQTRIGSPVVRGSNGRQIAIDAWRRANAARQTTVFGTFTDPCKTHTVPCSAADQTQCCNAGERGNGFLAGPAENRAMVRAFAQDIIATHFLTWTAEGAVAFLRTLQPFVDSGQISVPRATFIKAQEDAARARATASAATMGGITASAGAIVGAVGNVFFSIVNVVILALAQILPMAAGWACPPIPFKRTFDPAVAPECSFSDSFANELMPSLQDRFRYSNVRSGTVLFDARSTGCPPGDPLCAPGSVAREEQQEEAKPAVAKIIAATAIGLLLGGSTAYFLTR